MPRWKLEAPMRSLIPLLALSLFVAPSVAAAPRGATAEAVGIAGKALYPAAAGVMATRHKNKPTRPLSHREKQALRPVFGSLVERVRLTWGADPMDEWGDIQLGNTIGQTYGLRIYLRERDPGTWSRDTLALVIHELAHSRQYEHVGGSLPSFGYHYFKNWALAGYSYHRHPMELEAERTARLALDGAWAIYAGAREQKREALFRMLAR
jgi:hypothetical protein